MRWKRQGRWNSIASTNRFLVRLVCCNSIKVSWPNAFHLTDIKSSFFRYRKEKLLEFFSTYDTTEDSDKTPLNLSFLQFIIIHVSDKFYSLVLVFLRLVVAIQICSHAYEYEQLITGLNENYRLKDVRISISSLSLPRAEFLMHPFRHTVTHLPDPLLYKQWCFRRVTPARTFTDHIMMTALVRALEVPLKLERLNGGGSAEDNIYTGPGVVSVTLLYTGNHYDIIYPRAPSAEN
jgi:hypothetical protein